MATPDLEPTPGVECETCRQVNAVLLSHEAAANTPRCRMSLRPCGHHCNHIFTVEECHWCGWDADPGGDDEDT